MAQSAKNLSLTAIALPPVAIAGATAFFYFASPILVPLIAVSLRRTFWAPPWALYAASKFLTSSPSSSSCS